MYKNQYVKETVERTVQQFIEMLRESKGQNKWVKPFFSTTGFQKNPFTGTIYQGLNALILSVIAYNKGYTSNKWATNEAWMKVNRCMRKGEKKTRVIFCGKVVSKDKKGNIIYKVDKNGEYILDEKGEKQPETHYTERFWDVVNECQLKDYTEPKPEHIDENKLDKINQFKKEYLDRIGATYSEGHGHACYCPLTDTIELPSVSQYNRDMLLSYIPTTCHETVHWSGAKSRLNRDLSGGFGSESYALEELVADIGAGFISAEFNEPYLFSNNNLAYIESWVKILQDKPKALEDACWAAQKAAQYLLKLASED